MASRPAILGAIELGGTKILCAVGSKQHVLAETRISTGSPEAAIAAIGAFFEGAATTVGPIEALGVASFGPLDLDMKSPRYGAVEPTPKPGWSGFALRDALQTRLGCAVAIDTDVNAAALAEAHARASDGPVAYVTVGTGIGVGSASRHGIWRGRRHAEAGHFRPRRHALHGDFAGICPFHQDCLEGLASGPAVIAAWGGSLATLPLDHPAWAIEADYLGQLCSTIAFILAPDVVVIGGGVMSHDRLMSMVRERTQHWLGGYIADLGNEIAIEDFVTRHKSGDAPGLTGAFLLAAELLPSE